MDYGDHIQDVEKWKSKRRQKKGIIIEENPLLLNEATISSLSQIEPSEDRIERIEPPISTKFEKSTVTKEKKFDVKTEKKTSTKVASRKDRTKFDTEKKTITIRKTAEFNSFGFEIEQCTESSKTLISSVDAGSPADIAGVLVQDVLIEINELEVKNMAFDSIKKLIKDRYKLGHISLKLISTPHADSNSVKPTPTPSHHTSLEYFDADDIVDKRNTNSVDVPKPLIKTLVFDEVSQKQELRSDKIPKPAFDAVNIKEIITQFDDCHITDKPLFDSDATINDAPFKHETTEHGTIDQNESSNTISQMKDIEKQFTDEKDISNNQSGYKVFKNNVEKVNVDLEKVTNAEENISVLDKKPLYSSRDLDTTTDQSLINKEKYRKIAFETNKSEPTEVIKPEVNSEYKVQDNTRSSLKIEGQAKSKVLSLRNAFEDQSHAKEIKTLTPKKSRSNQNLLNIGLQTNDQQTYGVSMPLIKSSFESDSQIAPTRFTREDVIKEQQPILKSELSFDLSDIPVQQHQVKTESENKIESKSIVIERLNDDRSTTPVVNIHPGIKVNSPIECSQYSKKRVQEVSSEELCVACGNPLGSGTAVRIESLQVYFHMACFKCSECSRLIEMANDGVDVEVRSNYRLCCDRCSLMYKGFKGRYL